MISVITLCNGITILNGATWLSAPIPLVNLKREADLYLDLKVGGGTGTLTATQRLSDGTAYSSFVKPSAAGATIASTHGKTTNAVGRDIYSLGATPIIDNFMVVSLVAASADASNVTAKLIFWSSDAK